MAPTQDRSKSLVPTSLEVTGSGHGQLYELTFVAKDLFEIEGHTSSFGHPAWRATHSPASETAEAVSALLENGADLVGLTKMDQLAYSLIGDVGEGEPPINTNDPALFCGGSSSGSASAVAAGTADFALGTDTAGSVRVPAAICGVHGIRPTHGSISSSGVLPLAPSFDVPGLFAADAGILRQAFDACSNVAPSVTPSGITILLARDVFGVSDSETATVGAEVAERAANAFGSPLNEIAFASFTDAEVGNLFARIQSREIWAQHSSWVEAHGNELAPDVRTRLDRCRVLSQDPSDVQQLDLAARQTYKERFASVVPHGTVMVLPVLPEHGPKRVWAPEKLADFRAGCFRLTAPSSLTGAPQAVWSEKTPSGRSIGIGLITAPGDDRLLLDVLDSLTNQAPGES